MNLADSTGKPLDGTNSYVMHFTKSDLPPVSAFWSVTLYDAEGFQVANRDEPVCLKRSWMPFTYNPDGSLDLYFQNANPGGSKEANWLPALQGPVQFDDAAVRPEIGCAHGQMESAGGGENQLRCS